MDTRIIKANNGQLTAAELEAASGLWRSGELLAFPTETVYGLGANALDAEAVAAIFAVKGRPADNPLIVHLFALAQLEELAYVTEQARELMARFCPGPLTLVLKKKSAVPDIVSAGLDTAAFRFPSHKVARQLLEYSRLPIAAPSANLSGKPSPTLARHVYDDMQGRIPLIIDGGACDFGVESTVLDISGSRPVLLRPGAVTKEQLEEICGEVQLAGSRDAVRPAAPGMKYRHYAPRAEVLMAESAEEMCALYNELVQRGRTVLCLSAENAAALSKIPDGSKLILGREGDAAAFAHNIFAFFRYADEMGASFIIVQKTGDEGMGRAYMNRLGKAAHS